MLSKTKHDDYQEQTEENTFFDILTKRKTKY
jgi:hypothetical protein